MLTVYFCAIWVVDPNGKRQPACVTLTETPISAERALRLLQRNPGSIDYLTWRADGEPPVVYAFPIERVLKHVQFHPNLTQIFSDSLLLPLSPREYAVF